MLDLHQTLDLLVSKKGSDLHLKVGSPPLIRVNGALEPLEVRERLRPEETEALAREMLAAQPEKLAEFENDGEVDFAYGVPRLARFRVNAFRQRGSVSIVARMVPFDILTVEQLGLPKVISEIADEERGLILLTGTTGSGKSTTLAAMIDHINCTKSRHIVTIEDPIEYLHQDSRSIVNQREVGMDTHSFARAMRRVLRQDPDVILIGEMRDEETVRTALSAAETGHLVMSTVHTLDAPETVNRIIDFFQAHEHGQARAMLAGTLRAVISQRLVRTADGTGRAAVCEILRMTGRARDMILDPEQTGRLGEVITEGAFYGMQTFDQALLGLYKAGRITYEDAMSTASQPHDLKLLIAADGRTATTMDDLGDATEARNGSQNGSHDGSLNGAPSSAAPAPAPQVAAPRATPTSMPPEGTVDAPVAARQPMVAATMPRSTPPPIG
jgi:twitching motility protein PilT